MSPAAARSKTPFRMVVLAYNEAANLESLFERVRKAVGASGPDYRLFVVDDGSSDATPEVLEKLSASHPVEILRHGHNRGIAAAFLTGLRAAVDGSREDDAIFVLEGDGTSDPALLPALAEALGEDADVAVASRHVRGGAYRNFPPKRLFLSRAANLLLRWVCRIPGVRDYTIFYRAYRAGPLGRALAAYGDRFTSAGGFACNAEMLLRLGPFIRRVAEVPFVYDYGIKKGESSMKIGGNLRSYAHLFRIHFFDRAGPG